MQKNILVLILLSVCFYIPRASAQQEKKGALSGFVHDYTNGEAMIGATLVVKGTRLGSVTNSSGYFVIHSVPAGKQTLIVSSVGYTKKLIEVKIVDSSSSRMEIDLTPVTVNLNEVVVTGENMSAADKMYEAPVSKFELSGLEINAAPRVIESDLLRALQTLPGITAVSDFSSGLYVRGGTADQNMFLIDGADVYNPDHAFGLFSTFNTNAIKKVEVYKGGFSSEYGGRLSSVVDVINLDGNRNRVEGIVTISLLSGSTTIQVPVGSFGSISGSFRRTYLDQTYAKWSNKIPDYYFYDGNLKGFFEFSQRDKLSISYFSSKDNLDFKLKKGSPNSPGLKYEWGNITGSVNLKHLFNERLFASFWFTGSGYNSDFKINNIVNNAAHNELTDYALKASLEYYTDNNFSWKFGAEQKSLRFSYREDFSSGLIEFFNKSRFTTVYGDLRFRPDALWEMDFGLRASAYVSDIKAVNPEPRFSVKYRLSESNTLKFAAGRYFQYLNKIQQMFISSIWTSADKNTKPSSSNHFILSFQHELSEVLSLEVESYYKTYENIHQFNQNLSAEAEPGYHNAEGYPVYNSTKSIFTRGDGNTVGAEILLRKESGTMTGWFSYTYSKTEYKFDGINQGKSYSPRHDRASVVNLVVNGDLGDIFSGEFDAKPVKKNSRWSIGLNFMYATGQPITVPASTYFVSSIPDNSNANNGWGYYQYRIYPGTIDSYRLPPYARLDLSITYEKNYSGWTLAPFIQVFNIGNRKNTWFIQYETEGTGYQVNQKIEKYNMLPILPSIGVNIKF
jgi:hypothetical protein